jgi:hypothetical protein
VRIQAYAQCSSTYEVFVTRHLWTLAVGLLLGTTVLASPIPLSADDFKMYRHYLNALEDARVQKMKPEARVSAIAKDAGYKLKDLQKAIAQGEAAGDLKAQCEANLKEELGKTALSGRFGRTEVDLSQPHAVGYIQWLNDNLGQLEEEASEAAVATARACPILSSIQVWATDKSRPTARVFQGLISRTAAANIKPERVKDFADTRYIRLFEKVKSVVNGDDLSAEQL